VSEPVDGLVALAALRWAADVSCGMVEVASLATPLRATPAEHRAVPVPDARVEFDRLLLSKQPDDGLEALRLTGALDVWLPEVAALVGFGDGEWRHKDVWKHTKQVVLQSVPRLAVRWGSLLHDIGKIKTRTIEPSGEVHFFGHSEVGASMFRKRVGQRLGLEGELFERVHFLILHHLRASQYDASWTDSAVRRFAKEMGDGLVDLLDLSRADITTKRPEKRKRGLQQISDLSEFIRRVQEEDAKRPPLPKGLGLEVMTAFGLPPSKKIGDLFKALEACVEAGELEGGRDAAHYVEFVRAHRERFGV
jgi:poly(A) polymerase